MVWHCDGLMSRQYNVCLLTVGCMYWCGGIHVGHFPELVGMGYPEFFRSVFKRYGKVARIFEGRNPIVLVMDPELVG
jgi:hypothetical protein